MTDIGNKRAIGGLSREFYRRCGARYGVDEEWRFEPHVAGSVLADLLAEAGVPVYTRQPLGAVRSTGRRITSITTESGLLVRARVFLDATYEGDLMARAGVSYTVGREANACTARRSTASRCAATHQFDLPVDPYVTPGRPGQRAAAGDRQRRRSASTATATSRVQAYNFRMCLTRTPDNRIPFERPAGYDRREYELLARYLAGRLGRGVPQVRPDPWRQDRHEQQRRLLHRLHRPQLRLPRGRLRRARAHLPGPRDLPAGLHVVPGQRPGGAAGDPRATGPRGAWRRTSSPTPAAGRTSSTCARRGGWSATT